MRIAVVHHFVEQLIDNNEVVSDAFFLDIFEVAFEDIDECVQECEDHDCVVVFLGDGDEIEIVVFVEIEKVVVAVLDDGSASQYKYLRVYSSYSRIFLLKTS